MQKLLKIIDSLSNWSGIISAFLFLPGTIILIYEVVARYVFDAPTIWGHGMTQRIFAVYYFVCGGYVTLTHSHINMDLIYTRLGDKGKAYCDIVAFLFFFSFGGVLLWYGTRYAWSSMMQLEPCNTPLRAPLWPIKLSIPIGALLIMLQELANLYRKIYFLATGKQI